jgi:hypothetical protein
MVTDPRQIRRLGSGFSQVDSVFHKNYTAGCVHGVRTRLTFFRGKRFRSGKTPTPNVGFHVKPRLSTPSKSVRFSSLSACEHATHPNKKKKKKKKLTTCYQLYGTQPLHVLSVNLGLQLSGGPICKQCAQKKWRRRRRGFSCFAGLCA